MTSAPGPPAAPAPGGRARASALGDRRGLTTAGAVLVVLLASAPGLVYDLLRGPELSLVFAACFVAGAALAALLVNVRHLLAAVVIIPLIYVVLAVAASLARSGAGLSQQAVALVNAVFVSAPVLVAATLAAALVSGLRALGNRRG